MASLGSASWPPGVDVVFSTHDRRPPICSQGPRPTFPGVTPAPMANVVSEFWAFLRTRKKYWLAPILIVLLLLSVLIVATAGSALAPFIYALF